MNTLRRLYRLIRREPAMTLAAIQAVAALAATFGFELSPEQQGALWSLLAILLGLGVRRMVTPIAKVEEAGMEWRGNSLYGGRWVRQGPKR